MDFLFQAKAAEIDLECDIAVDGVEYSFDAESFRKILQNLLSNAIKFTPAGGSVNIKAHVDSESNLLAIDVIDTGIGIPPDKLNKVFNRFFQVDDSRTRSYSGTGIGLSLVKELTELLGGSIAASNNSSGKGTDFVTQIASKQFNFSGYTSTGTYRHPGTFRFVYH